MEHYMESLALSQKEHQSLNCPMEPNTKQEEGLERLKSKKGDLMANGMEGRAFIGEERRLIPQDLGCTYPIAGTNLADGSKRIP